MLNCMCRCHYVQMPQQQHGRGELICQRSCIVYSEVRKLMTSPLYCLATLYNYYHAFITLWFRESEPKTSESIVCPWDIFYSTCPNVRRRKWKKIIQNEKWKVAKIWRRFSWKINYFLTPLNLSWRAPGKSAIIIAIRHGTSADRS